MCQRWMSATIRHEVEHDSVKIGAVFFDVLFGQQPMFSDLIQSDETIGHVLPWQGSKFSFQTMGCMGPWRTDVIDRQTFPPITRWAPKGMGHSVVGDVARLKEHGPVEFRENSLLGSRELLVPKLNMPTILFLPGGI